MAFLVAAGVAVTVVVLATRKDDNDKALDPFCWYVAVS